MNYFAHGRPFLQDPYMLAGTAVPDWLSVVDRRVRARARLARPHLEDGDLRVAGVARGVVRHHDDDDWFHRTRAFSELSMDFTVAIRDLLAPDNGFRPSFLGHIMVEILLDAELIRRNPGQLDAYYRAINVADPGVVSQAVGRIATGPVDGLPRMIQLFGTERFLYDYLDDSKLLKRLNRVMQRVRLPALPMSFHDFLPDARRAVRRQLTGLLTDERLARVSVVEEGEIQ